MTRRSRPLVVVLGAAMVLVAACGTQPSEVAAAGTTGTTRPSSSTGWTLGEWPGRCSTAGRGEPDVDLLTGAHLADWITFTRFEEVDRGQKLSWRIRLLDGTARRGGGAVPSELAVSGPVVAELQRAAGAGTSFVSRVGHTTSGPRAVLTMARSPGGIAQFLDVCGEELTARVRQAAIQHGVSVPDERGFPLEFFDGCLDDEVCRPSIVGRTSAPSTTVWTDRSPASRQIIPGETPPEYLATLTSTRLIVTAPLDWFPTQSSVLDMGTATSLCARSSAGYGICVGLTQVGGPTKVLTAHREPGTSVEIVRIVGSNYATATVLAVIPPERLTGPDLSVVFEGTTDAPTVSFPG